MPANPEDDDLFRPTWDSDDDTALDPPGRRRAQKQPVEPDYHHPLLTPLARAQDAVARLQAKAEMASPAVTEGLLRRLSYLEAAGWLRCASVTVHPWDLALRDEKLTPSIGAAARVDQLASVLPSTVAQEPGLEFAPSVAVRLDIDVERALGLARLWRRLAELRSWRPLADAGAVRKTLQSLGSGVTDEAVIADWLDGVYTRQQGPMMIRAGRAALDWSCQPGVRDRDPHGVFLAACLWREKTAHAPIPLPFWSAPEQHHHRRDLRIGVDWMAGFLECVTAAALIGLRELARLLEAEKKRENLGITARSRLPDAVDAVLRAPVVTADSLAKALHVTPRAALGLLRHLTEAGIVREATGRASWRAFALDVRISEIY